MSSIRRPLSRLLCCLLLLVFLCSPASAAVGSAHPSSNKVDVTTFLDSFDSRYELFTSMLSSDDYTGKHTFRKEYMAMTLDTSMRITQIEIPLILSDAIYDDEEFTSFSCITAFTIFECPDPETSKTTLFSCIAQDFGNIPVYFESAGFVDKLVGSSEPILVYQSNYDYYVKLSDSCSSDENTATDNYCIHLIASAR